MNITTIIIISSILYLLIGFIWASIGYYLHNFVIDELSFLFVVFIWPLCFIYFLIRFLIIDRIVDWIIFLDKIKLRRRK